MLTMLRQDVRLALRTLGKNPAFALTAIVSLALAIGGNTAMFTVIRAVLLKPLEYPDPDRLVSITGGATPARLAKMRETARSFSGIGAYTGSESLTLSGGSEPEVVLGVRVSAGFLRIVGVDPIRGRDFRPEEERPGGAPVAIISYQLWQRRFGGDPQIVGRTALLEGLSYTIVGVLPQDFRFPSSRLDVWLTGPAEDPLIPPKVRALSPYLTLFGRLKTDISLEQANAELKVIRRQYAIAYPTMLDAKAKSPREVAPLKDELVGDTRSMLWMLFGAVGFVLLIACANLAGLLLARATTRSREFAVRAALGAGRGRLIAQLMAESVLVACAGGILGLILATSGVRMIPKITAFSLPRAGEVRVDWLVLGFAAALSLATGVVFGLAPALRASRPDLFHLLRLSGAGANEGMRRLNLRTLLSVAQIALSMVLLIGAALLIESVAALHRVDLGFDAANLLTVRISLPPLRYDTDQKRTAFYDELLRDLNTVPGVRSATAAWYLPMMGGAGTPVQDAAQPPLKLNERPIETIISVSPGYFRTFGIGVKRGRDFNAHDLADSQRVTIIDEGLARQLWPGYPAGPDPVGRHIYIGGINPHPAEIVGIVANVRENLEANIWPGTVYLPFAQGAPQSGILALRTSVDPLSLTEAVRDRVQAIDRDQPISDARTMQDLIEGEVGERRLLVMLLGSFAMVAVFLSLTGIYGVIAYSVAQRTREVGIRQALGAQRSDILKLILRQGSMLALAGVAGGLVVAWAVTRVMSVLLYQVSPTDPVTFAGVALSFLVVALAACYIPARRAARLDPLSALSV